MKRMIRYLCTLVFFVVAATSAAHSYCANLNTLGEAKGIACCCAVHTDCNVLQSSCCSVSQSEQAVVPQLDEAPTQPLVPAVTTIAAHLLPVTVLTDSKSRDLSCVPASNKLYLQKRSLLI